MRKLLIIMTICGLITAFILAEETPENSIINTLTEITGQRTEKSETFKTSNGKHMIRIYTGKKFYKEGNAFKKVNLTETLEAVDGFTHVIEAGPYSYRYDSDNVRKGYRFERDGYYVTYSPAGNWDGIIQHVEPKVTGIKEIIFMNSEAGSSVSWELKTNALLSVSNGEITFRDSNKEFLFRTSKPWAQDADGNFIDIFVNVSGDTLAYDLSIPQNVTWPITIDPNTTIDDSGTATGLMRSIYNGSYTSARNAEESGGSGGGVYNSLILIGQRINSTYYYVDRSALSFDTSSLPEDAIIDSVDVVLVAEVNYTSGSNFSLTLVEGTFSGTTVVNDWFNDFEGWTSSGTYPVVSLANTIGTSTYTTGDTLRFRLNTTGLGTINKTGNTNFMILSDRDISETTPPGEEQTSLLNDSPFIQIWYSFPLVESPANFSMTALTPTSIACSWDDMSDNEQCFYIIDAADSSIVDSLAADAVTDTITCLSENTQYIWTAVADSSGSRGYSEPDSAFTLVAPPDLNSIFVQPVSSDTLRISVTEPPNSTSGNTGMEVDAVTGYGATESGWITGQYSYLDGGLNPDSTYIYAIRLCNGDGVPSEWSPLITYEMQGLDTLVVILTDDFCDDYNINYGTGMRDSTVIRAGTSDSGDKQDGFVSFTLPWTVVNGGVDSLFLSMTRTDEGSDESVAVQLYGLPVKHDVPVEQRNLGQQDTTCVSLCWTISNGAVSKTSPDLRSIFREWQDMSSDYKDFTYDFGLKLDDNLQSAGVSAVFIDASHPSYSHDTFLTIYYTPGYPDSLEYAPADFAVSALAPDSLRASWTDTSESEYGFVLLNLADSTMVTGTDTLSQNTESVNVGGLIPNTLYEWFVRAYTAVDDSSSAGDSAYTFARIPGTTGVSAVSSSSIRFIIDPQDNPAHTKYAVQDSISGLYVDWTANPDTLRTGPPGDWGWRTYDEWGAASGDTLAALSPDSLYGIRVKARNEE